MPVESVSDYFETVLPKRVQKAFEKEGAQDVNYKFIVTGEGGGTWVVELGENAGIVKDGPDARCTITVAAPTFLKILNGDMNVKMAFVTGKIKVAGDMAMAMKLGTLMA